MTGRPDLADRLATAVREEIRACAMVSEPLPSLPPPSDVDAERAIVGAVVSAEITTTELGDLEAEHMYLGLHRWIYQIAQLADAAGVTVCPGLLIARAGDEGIAADSLAPEIQALAEQPWVHPHRLREAAQLIIDASHARRLIRKMQKVDMALRTGVRTPEQARAYLASLDAR